MEETKQKKRVRFNAIDFLIVVVVIGCIVGVFMRYNLAERFGVNVAEHKAEISFLIKEMDNTAVEAMVVGDAFYKQNGVLIGYLKERTAVASESYMADSRGLPKVLYSDTESDVTGVLAATGTFAEDGSFTLAGGHFIAPGTELEVSSPHIRITLLITDIQQLD